MQRIVPLLISLLCIVVFSNAQDIKTICSSINNLNTAVINGAIKKQDAAAQFKNLMDQLKKDGNPPKASAWVFPLKGYKSSAVGGTNGNGYSDNGYNYFDGNKHTAHPAHDIFINDRNQDGMDDRTHKPVDVLAVDDGIVLACSNEWEPGSNLRGGKYIWIYHYTSGIITYYAHNNSIFVKPGDEVKQGQKIAEVGRTGYSAYKKRSPTHLHFSAFKLVDDLPVPFNPYQQLKKSQTFMKSVSLLMVMLCWITPVKPDNVLSRFKMSAGYKTSQLAAGSFGAWLQALPLKPAGTPARTYKGDIARTDLYTAAVVDMSIGNQDLQQCADAVMRLRGEYLYRQKDYKAITFNFTSGFRCDFEHYANGYRYSNERWVLKAGKDYSYPNFMRYMNLVFAYAGTLSLQTELKKVTAPDDIKTGDVFIKGGSPGHCFIVMNVAENARHHKKFLLAQSFMPAQNIQVLQDNGDPWFSLDKRSNILYSELISKNYLKRFE